MTAQEMVKHQDNRPAKREETRSVSRVMIPAVDIYESDDNLTVIADMPGDGKEGLEINLEQGVLTINGNMQLESHGKNLLNVFSTTGYHRQFRLFEHIDAEKTSAELHNGVLTPVTPQATSSKPRKIEIRQLNPATSR